MRRAVSQPQLVGDLCLPQPLAEGVDALAAAGWQVHLLLKLSHPGVLLGGGVVWGVRGQRATSGGLGRKGMASGARSAGALPWGLAAGAAGAAAKASSIMRQHHGAAGS